MDENQFWQIVDQIGWPDADYDRARTEFRGRYGREACAQFRSLFGTKKKLLSQISGNERTCCDSWDDVTAHVIGLGRTEFEAIIADPQRINIRHAAGDYRESFAYCIPFGSDYDPPPTAPTAGTIQFYDQRATTLAEHYEQIDFSVVLDKVCSFIAAGGRVLEIGCGSGRDSAELLRRGFDVQAVDASAAMLERATAIHPELAGRVTQHILPTELPFAEDSFDAVLAFAVLMHLPSRSPQKVFSDIVRVLRPGGICAYSATSARPGLDSAGRDRDGRLFLTLSLDEWLALHTGAGLSTLWAEDTADLTDRPGIRWATAVAKLD